MPKLHALLFGDAHVQESPDSEYALAQISRFAVAAGVRFVGSLGDFHEKQRNRSRPIVAATDFVNELTSSGIEFGFLQGNHDADDPPWLLCCPHARHLNKQSREIVPGLMSYWLDWQPSGVLQESLDEIPPGTDLLCAHQAWADWMGSITLPQGEFADIPVVEMLVSGDLHKFVLDKTRGKDGQKMTVCSPGATYQCRSDEPATHYFVTIDRDGALKKHELKSRVFVACSVLNKPEDLEAFLSSVEGELAAAVQRGAALELPDALMKPRFKVTYSHRLDDAVRRIIRAVDGRATLSWRELPPEEKSHGTTWAGKDRDVSPDEVVTPITELPAIVDKEQEPEVFALLERTLSSSDREQAFAAWRKEFLEA